MNLKNQFIVSILFDFFGYWDLSLKKRFSHLKQHEILEGPMHTCEYDEFPYYRWNTLD